MIHDNLYNSVLSQYKLNSICSTLESTQTPYLTTFNTMNKVEEYLHLYEICTKSLITYQLIMYFYNLQGAKKLCPQCNMITSPNDLRRIYL